jgi:hypothetical protein
MQTQTREEIIEIPIISQKHHTWMIQYRMAHQLVRYSPRYIIPTRLTVNVVDVHDDHSSSNRLQRVLNTLRSIRNRYIVDFDYHSRTEDLRLLQLAHVECTRLRQDPQAFPDRTTYETFFAAVNRYTKQIQVTIQLWREHHQRHEEVAKDALEKKLQAARPKYSPELVSKPWQQFLSREATAWPVNWRPGPGVIVKQSIPNGGVRIIEKWESELKDIYDWLDIVRFPDT